MSEGMSKTEAEPSAETGTKKEDGDDLFETIRTIFFALVIALVFRSFAYQPFNIPSESMLPTLLVGDYLFVSKYSYGYSRYSFPFGLPLFDGRIMESDVKRGDVVVFKLPRDGKTDYIKRILGLPGDRLQMRDGVLYINEQPVTREKVDDFVNNDPNVGERRARQYRETLPNGVSYLTLDLYDGADKDNTQVFRVPANSYFALGDNRDNSQDSRFPSGTGVGYVPAENLVGRAEIIAFSTNGEARLWEFWKWFQATRGSRIFQTISE